ncbi:uncharacterized protein N7511_008002 [Penicillium nucicola]|uniref:uncharacterized protein n=1 Tax=Penicillium nucicola TaxID=1850975 RepID=UPI002545104E|nr:uncharacterized protein N7511_008002 [Penicillium nucicola]KAJ5753849.1 hypothetical protein N7511_008002 [Penicillium nucicola]
MEEVRGKKRPAQCDPDGAQPLTKRFGRLRIDSLPISARAKGEDGKEDMMLLDDTRHTTYIHNLDQELEGDSSDGLIFSPLATKLLSVPTSVLSSQPSGKELVLYTEPASLTVPKDRDNIRKAILESRARARTESQDATHEPSPSVNPSRNPREERDEPDRNEICDAMEIDNT